MSIIIIVIFLFLVQESSSTMTNGMSAYDVLRSNDLPIGLLPSSITNFTVSAAGDFDLRLAAPCIAKFETEVRYAAAINGTISFGKIASLRGVEAQELFLWFPVHEIRVNSPSTGLIYFDVGVIHKQFSLSLFEIPPVCVPDGNSKGRLHDEVNVADAAEIAVL